MSVHLLIDGVVSNVVLLPTRGWRQLVLDASHDVRDGHDVADADLAVAVDICIFLTPTLTPLVKSLENFEVF